ncbi:MAG: hypothetical protein R3C51_01225 [Parvularculaceae bacterium]
MSNSGKNDDLVASELGRPPQLDSAEHNRLVEAAELDDIRMMQSSFSVVPRYFDEAIADMRNFEINSSITEPVFDAESKKLISAFEYCIEVNIEGEQLLYCKAMYLVAFTIEGDFDLETMKYFARRVGRNASYPYFREFASSQSWASNADLPILPILKTGSVKKSAAEISAAER